MLTLLQGPAVVIGHGHKVSAYDIGMPENQGPEQERKIGSLEFQGAIVQASLERVHQAVGYERPSELQARADEAVAAMVRGNYDDARQMMSGDYETHGGSLAFLINQYAQANFPGGFDESDPWLLGAMVDMAQLWWQHGYLNDGQIELSQAYQMARGSRKRRDVISPEVVTALRDIERQMVAIRMNTPQETVLSPEEPSGDELARLLEAHLPAEVCDEIRGMPYREGLMLAANVLAEHFGDPIGYLEENGLLY
jgi:predicted phosphodiesterase